MGFVQIDIDEFDRLTFLAHIGARLNRIEVNAIERGHHTTADAIHRLVSEIGKALRDGAEDAITDPAAIRAQFEADATAEQLVEHERQWGEQRRNVCPKHTGGRHEFGPVPHSLTVQCRWCGEVRA